MDMALVILFTITYVAYFCTGLQTDDGLNVEKQRSACIAKLVPAERIRIPGCYERIIEMNRCFGACFSKNVTVTSKKHYSLCTCCQPVEFEDKRELFGCLNENLVRVVRTIIIKNPTSCSCKKCRS